MESGANKPSNAIMLWTPMVVFVASLVFVIGFAMSLPIDRIIIASAVVAIMVFGGFFLAFFLKKMTIETSD